MQGVQRKRPRSYETDIKVTSYMGRNSWGNHSALNASQSRELINWDLFAGQQKDFCKSRRGSSVLKAVSDATKRGSTSILNQVTWDIGDEEYLITQEGTTFFFQALIDTADPVQINDVNDDPLTVSEATRADMFVSDDRLFIFHPGGNKIIEWNETVFVGMPMGISYPYIESLAYTSGVISGNYTIGIEKVYRTTSDRMASTPNRMYAGTNIIASTGTITNAAIQITINDAELDNDELWTHIRVYRSKNKDTDYTDPLQPIDAQGNDDELYEEALVTREELEHNGLAGVSTEAGLPSGNAGTEAGTVSGDYVIQINNPDDVLFYLVGIERIELIPLPAASVGCFHGKRIYVSAVADTTLDDQSRNNIYYSNFAGSKYACQYDPFNFVTTGGDGQRMIKLISFEQDIIGIKESKTGRLQGGNVDLEFEILDQRIGISHPNLAAFIPAVGIVALTNDNGDFRVFGYDLRWQNQIRGMDVSSPIRVETITITPANVSFAYLNGKLWVSDGTGTMYILHEKESRGWTTYNFPMNDLAERLFTFGNGLRGAVVSKNTHLVEIDVDGVNTDYNTADDTTDAITLTETTWRFQSEDGRDNLEYQYLAVSGQFSTPIIGIPYVNGLPWPDAVTATETGFTPDPTIYGSLDALTDREYRLYLEPSTIGGFSWCRCRGNFLHYTLTTEAPAIMREKLLSVIVDEDGLGIGEFDPFQTTLAANKLPAWNTSAYLVFNFDDDGITLYDQSGGGRNHTWTNGAGSRAHIASMPPRGGESATGGEGSGWYRTSFNGLDYIGDASGLNSRDMAFRFVVNFPSLSAPVTIQGGGNGTSSYWMARANEDGSLEFQILTSALAYKFTTSSGTVSAGTNDYTLIFFLTDGGATGEWYAAQRTDNQTIARVTTRAAII